MKSTYSIVVRGDKGEILWADSTEIIYDKAIVKRVEGEAMLILAKNLTREGAYRKTLK